MSYRYEHGFVGLYPTAPTVEENQYDFRTFIDLVSDSADTFDCEYIQEEFPFTHITEHCPAGKAMTLTAEFTILDAAAHLNNSPDEAGFTLGDFLAAPLPPDFLQIVISMAGAIAWELASPGCAASPGGCSPTVQDHVDLSVATTLAGVTFPFDTTDTELGGGTVVNQRSSYNTDDFTYDPHAFVGGSLRRPTDGETYTGNPDNLAVDTLIPAADFDSGTTVSLIAECNFLHEFDLSGVQIRVTPWWILAPSTAPGRLMCVL